MRRGAVTVSCRELKSCPCLPANGIRTCRNDCIVPLSGNRLCQSGQGFRLTACRVRFSSGLKLPSAIHTRRDRLLIDLMVLQDYRIVRYAVPERDLPCSSAMTRPVTTA